MYSYLPAETVGEIKDLLKHSWHGAGSLMNTEFIAVKKDLTAGEVVKKIRDEFSKVESIYYIYILDDDETVIGLTNLRELLMADPATPLSELMQENIVKVDVEDETSPTFAIASVGRPVLTSARLSAALRSGTTATLSHGERVVSNEPACQQVMSPLILTFCSFFTGLAPGALIKL